jgi:hypothetical protein
MLKQIIRERAAAASTSASDDVVHLPVKRAVTTTEIIAQAAFTLVVMLRLWKGWDYTLSLLLPGVEALAYVTPSLLIARGSKSRRVKIVAINLLLGWTGIGWLVSLAMAMSPPSRRATANQA